METSYISFKNALLQSDKNTAGQILQNQLEKSKKIEMLESMLTPALEDIGLEWVNGDVSLIQVYMSGRICEELINNILEESKTGNTKHPVTAITCLTDNHLLGKRILLSLFKTRGYNLIDYGGGISVEDLFKKIQEDKVEILLVSTLMLNSALKIADLKELIDKARMKTLIVAGGAPFRFDKNLWREVGADYTADTAIEGLNLYSELIKEVEL